MLPKSLHEINPELFPSLPDDPYSYPGISVLNNKFNLRDYGELTKREFHFYLRNKNDLRCNPIEGNYDFDHLKAIHHHLFKDVYDWAGQPRTNVILDMKNYVLYCPAKDIEKHAKETFDNLKKENYLKNLEPNKFTERAADHYIALERIHPFRDGNARTQAEFFRELALENGYQLDLGSVNIKILKDAKQVAFSGSKHGLEKMENVMRDALDIPNLERYRVKIHDMKGFKTFDRDIWINIKEAQSLDPKQLNEILTKNAEDIIKRDSNLSKYHDLRINIKKIETTKKMDFQKQFGIGR